LTGDGVRTVSRHDATLPQRSGADDGYFVGRGKACQTGYQPLLSIKPSPHDATKSKARPMVDG